MATKPNPKLDLAHDIAGFTYDPLGHAMYAYPWGEGVLAGVEGPRQWQIDVMEDIREHLENPETRYTPLRLARASGHGIGKLLCYKDFVPTPLGIRRWGDLQEGDDVFGADGLPTQIIATHHFADVPMYRVTFDDGSFCEVSSGHLWNVRGRQERRKKVDGWRTLETVEILDKGVKRPNGTAQARQWEIPIQGAAQFDEREVDVHPYVMGIWLGDGTKGKPAYTKPYPEIKEAIEALGYEVSTAADGRHHRFIGVARLFKGGVFDCGSHERFIPDDYKFNTAENRWALFRGLVDTDGEVHGSGSIGYSSTSERLALDVQWLARSLGCKAMISGPQRGAYPGVDGEYVECRDYWRLTINCPVNPFTLKHRKERYKPSEARYLTRWIDSIEPIDNADGMCITVAASDGLYLANDFIVTHNSALIAMIVKWGLDTCDDCRIVITANTENQLITKTSPEIIKWHNLSITKDWFKATATKLASTVPGHAEAWRADLVTWSENNTEAFAGLHNKGKRIIVVLDEASRISPKVWEVILGALTDEGTEILFLAFGNPTQNTGAFRECFGKHRHLWKTEQIDSRTVEGVNKAYLDELVATYGENSDIVKVRVRGMFPSASSMQFIASALVAEAKLRIVTIDPQDPLVMGVDVARFGDDDSVIRFRRGRDARSIPPIRMHGASTMELASKVAEQHRIHNADVICVDGGGVGGGVVDRCAQLGLPVVEVGFGENPLGLVQTGEGEKVANRRAEIWVLMRQWLKGGMIDDAQRLEDDLIGPEYTFNGDDEILLEKKAHMKARGLASPDDGDALALTFAVPVLPSYYEDEADDWRQPERSIDGY